MDNFKKLYYAQCDKYKELGFKRVKQSYARIINDVLQVFTLKRWRFGYVCTVEFGVRPLCGYVPNYNVGIQTLDKYKIETYGGWNYIPNNEESIEQCVRSIVETIESHMMPLFEQADCCKNAPSVLMEAERQFERNRLTSLALEGTCDRAKPFEERILLNSDYYYMALKNGDVGYAEKYLSFKIKHYLDSLNMRTSQPYDVIESNKEALEKYRLYLSKIEKKDIAFFDNIIKQNEGASRIMLSQPQNGRLS